MAAPVAAEAVAGALGFDRTDAATLSALATALLSRGETDNVGLPDPNYDDGRIRQVVAYLLGFAQFQEQ